MSELTDIERGFWVSTDEEYFNDGPYPSREAAIEEYLAMFDDPNETFYVGEAEVVSVSDLVPCGERVLDLVHERACDFVGTEGVDNWAVHNEDGVSELTAKIEEAVGEYIEKYPKKLVHITDITEYICRDEGPWLEPGAKVKITNNLPSHRWLRKGDEVTVISYEKYAVQAYLVKKEGTNQTWAVRPCDILEGTE